MVFIPDSYVLESVSIGIQDVILPLGRKYAKFTEIAPDTPTLIKPGLYKASKSDWIYLHPQLNDAAYFSRVSARFNRLDPTKNFEPADLIDTAVVLPPNHIGVRLDYKNGLIYKSGSVIDSLKVVYSYKTVRVVTTWPEKVDDADLPTIAILDRSVMGEDFAIGTDQKNDRYTLEVHLFAESDGQRKDIESLLRQALKVGIIPLFDFRDGTGYPLTTRLEKNTGFSAVSQLLGYLRVEEFSISVLPKLGIIKAERHRALGKLTVSLIN
jgi:hypothetical protein